MFHTKFTSIFLILTILCQLVFSAPGLRYKRADDSDSNAADLNPVDLPIEEGSSDGLDREKRKLPEAKFAAKNAILGFVFGQIDSLIDSKTRFIDALDRTNIAKNKQYGIVAPAPINDFQSLVTAIITPKISAITNKIGSLSGSFLGGSGGSGDGDANGGSAAGLSGILGSLLRLSGPILSSSSGAVAQGGVLKSDDSEETTESDV